MSKLTDAEINKAVAKKIFPETAWSSRMFFDYTSEISGFTMAVWLANHIIRTGDSIKHGFIGVLSSRNPQHALAMAIMEVDV